MHNCFVALFLYKPWHPISMIIRKIAFDIVKVGDVASAKMSKIKSLYTPFDASFFFLRKF